MTPIAQAGSHKMIPIAQAGSHEMIPIAQAGSHEMTSIRTDRWGGFAPQNPPSRPELRLRAGSMVRH